MPRSQPRPPQANLQDPEVQYRKLQEQLGLVEPTGLAVNDHVESEPVELLSTDLGFKSMIGKNQVKTMDSSKPATTRKRARFNLAKPRSGGDLE
jgi:hypothetical protein